MASQTVRSLGFLNLERKFPPGAQPPKPKSGSLLNPDTYGFSVITETVAGAWSDRVICGDPMLEPACIGAARRLLDRGAVAISSNCGFFMRHQAAVAAAVNVPVALSSLLLVPMLLRQLPARAKLAVVTADSRHCGEDLLGLNDPVERSRIVIGGVEEGEWFVNLMKDWSEDESERPPTQTYEAHLEADVANCVARLRAAHPEIMALVLECTGFPPVAPTLRRITGLPVYDITTLCRLMLASVT
ncbi:hypothetical protein [Bradyrhizobium sp. 144]|uniref:hypothetical protein n=1 Tax=Bradyrhizobium sp. 144 TaxID=2782620 RepID=UPI001FFACA00|nr:hypothetical protein [Bradyrhizobium sp. 144]MCK1698568.1 hypothetical protein [Bradyrhizobium sp. 144]